MLKVRHQIADKLLTFTPRGQVLGRLLLHGHQRIQGRRVWRERGEATVPGGPASDVPHIGDNLTGWNLFSAV